MEKPASRPRLAKAWPAAVVLACAGHALAGGWGRYGDVIVDTGRELEWPRRILEGEWLYRDLRFYYGPLAPHLNALLYALFGVRVEVLAAAGAVTALLMAWVVYLTARALTGRPGATAAAVTFVYACAFAYLDERAIFNFVLPHTFAATYGILAASASLLFLLRHLRSGRRLHLALSLAGLGLAALSKVEVLFAAAAAHAVFLATRPRAGGARRLLAAYALTVAAVALAYLPFALVAGSALWSDNLAGVMNPASAHFVRMQMGLDEPGMELARMGVALAVLAVAGGLALGAGALANRWSRLGAAAWAPAAVPPLVFAWVFDRFSALAALPFRAVTAIVAAGAAVAAVAWWRRPDRRERTLPGLLVCSFALAALGRIVLNATPELYGYFLLPPAIVCLAAALFEVLPGLLPAAGPGRHVVAVVAAAFLACQAWALAGLSRERLAAKRVPLVTARGALALTDEDAALLLPVARALAEARPGATLLALPHAMSLAFLTGHPAPDGSASHLPMEFDHAHDDAVVRAGWERRPPDLVFWLDEEMAYFGGERFCVTYGKAACGFLLERYVPVLGPVPSRYGPATLLARRDVAPRP